MGAWLLQWRRGWKGGEEGQKEEEKNGINIPDLLEGEIVNKNKINTEQRFTKPPVRFTEASLIKEMESLGIGRPSTYASTITTLTQRSYVKITDKKLFPTEKNCPPKAQTIISYK